MMMKNVWTLWVLICFATVTYGQKKNTVVGKETSRAFWLKEMDRMARPVMRSLAHDSLKINMPQITSIAVDNKEHRIQVQYVEVLGRVLSGISPWLALNDGSEEEQVLRKQYRNWTIQALKNALDSNANDFMRFDLGGQQLVDASFISVAFCVVLGYGIIWVL